MNIAFDHLSNEEQTLLIDAIAFIAILIAGADGEVDDEEKTQAIKMANIRSFAPPEELNTFYEMAEKNLEEKMETILKVLPDDANERNKVLTTQLTKLNRILPKLNFNFRKALYESYRSFARHIARASGGVLGMMAINKQESNLIELPMIKPITDAPQR